MKWRSLEESDSQQGDCSLHAIYAERKALIAKYVPAEIQDVHSRVIEELRQSGILNRALQVGKEAQDVAHFHLLVKASFLRQVADAAVGSL